MRVALAILACTTLTACEPGYREVQIPFGVAFDGQPISCNSDDPVALTDLRFYVYDIEFKDANGKPIAARLTRDAAWQNGTVALLDMEAGGGSCVNGTSNLNDTVNVSVASDVELSRVKGLGFTLGVPFELNHNDPLSAVPPLDDSAMHWHWRSGYKFLRTGVEVAGDGFWFHLGSTACKGTTGNITGCEQPNRAHVELAEFVPGRDLVVIDLGTLFASVDFDDGQGSDCSSGPLEASCPPVLAALGLSTGDYKEASSVFVSRPVVKPDSQ